MKCWFSVSGPSSASGMNTTKAGPVACHSVVRAGARREATEDDRDGNEEPHSVGASLSGTKPAGIRAPEQSLHHRAHSGPVQCHMNAQEHAEGNRSPQVNITQIVSPQAPAQKTAFAITTAGAR